MKTNLLKTAIAAAALSASPAVFSEVNVSTKGGLKVETENHSFQLGGRIQYDYNRAELNGEVEENDFDLRRGRIVLKGNVTDDWHFKVNFNVDGGGEEDLYIQYKGWGPLAELTVGRQHHPFSLEQLISSKDVSISERSGITEGFAIGRQEGIKLSGNTDVLHYAIGAFTEEGEDEDTGLAARAAYVPYKADGRLVHVGAAIKDTESQEGYGLELASVFDAAHFQAEYFSADQIADDGSEAEIDGYYIQAGYFLTGEIRPYKKGVFKRIKPSKESGAWELVARYSDGDGSYGDVELGTTDASVMELGVNYYPSYNVRINASYMDAEDNLSDDEGNEFRVRFQLTF